MNIYCVPCLQFQDQSESQHGVPTVETQRFSLMPCCVLVFLAGLLDCCLVFSFSRCAPFWRKTGGCTPFWRSPKIKTPYNSRRTKQREQKKSRCLERASRDAFICMPSCYAGFGPFRVRTGFPSTSQIGELVSLPRSTLPRTITTFPVSSLPLFSLGEV